MAERPLVLLAEDEPHIVESLSFLLRRAGFEVRAETTGDSALATAIETLPTVFLIDVMLPGIDGLEVLRRLRAAPGGDTVKAVVLTAKGRRQDREDAMQSGADLFISKPFSNQQLVAAVEKLAGTARKGTGNAAENGTAA